MARLLFVRHGGYADMVRRYRIYVDDAEIGTIKRHSSLRHDLPPGTYRIAARIDWGRAEPITITLAPGEKRQILVANTHGAFKAGYAITAGAKRYLSLIDQGPITPENS